MAERNGALLRRRLCSAERLSDSATARGLRLVNTPRSRSSASLVRMTRADQRLWVRAMPRPQQETFLSGYGCGSRTAWVVVISTGTEMCSWVIFHGPLAFRQPALTRTQ